MTGPESDDLDRLAARLAALARDGTGHVGWGLHQLVLAPER